MTDWNEEYRAKVRDFMARNGKRILVDKRYGFDPDDAVSPYGWTDYDAMEHVRSVEIKKYPGEGCHWIIPEGAVLYERTYYMFNGTFHDNTDEIGVNVKGCRCACGKYEDAILRWTGSVGEMLHDILNLPDSQKEVTL